MDARHGADQRRDVVVLGEVVREPVAIAVVPKQRALRKSRAAAVVQPHAHRRVASILVGIEVRQPVRHLPRSAGIRVEGPVHRPQLRRVAKPESHVGGAAGDPERIVRKLARRAELIRGQRVIQPVRESAVDATRPMIGRKRTPLIYQRPVRPPSPRDRRAR